MTHWVFLDAVALPKFRKGESESETRVGQERKPWENSWGGAEIEEELTYGLLRNPENTSGIAEGWKEEQMDKCLKANVPHEVIPNL